MRKILALILLVAMMATMAACSISEKDESSVDSSADSSVESSADSSVESSADSSVESSEEASDDSSADESGDDTTDDGIMSHDEYIAAELNTEVVIETYVQAHQSWWDNKITVYCQSEDGAYFLYELACSEEDAAKLVPGTAIRVTGYKAEWAGEIEIVDATFEFIEKDAYIAPAFDATALLGTDALIDHQNEFVSFKGLTVEKIEYKNGEPGDDIYLTFGKDGASYDFCVEYYLTGTETEVYTTVGTLNVGDVVNVEGFLYWYNGVNTHVTAITLA